MHSWPGATTRRHLSHVFAAASSPRRSFSRGNASSRIRRHPKQSCVAVSPELAAYVAALRISQGLLERVECVRLAPGHEVVALEAYRHDVLFEIVAAVDPCDEMMELDAVRRVGGRAAVRERPDTDAARALLCGDDPLPFLRGCDLAPVAALATGELRGLRMRLPGH